MKLFRANISENGNVRILEQQLLRKVADIRSLHKYVRGRIQGKQLAFPVCMPPVAIFFPTCPQIEHD